jgi:hypothetical protein
VSHAVFMNVPEKSCFRKTESGLVYFQATSVHNLLFSNVEISSNTSDSGTIRTQNNNRATTADGLIHQLNVSFMFHLCLFREELKESKLGSDSLH